MDKVSGLLESKVEAARLQAIQETEAAGNVERLTLVEAHQKEVADLKENFTLQLAEKVDSFLNAVVEEWANKNAPAIDAQIKTEAAERFLTGFSNVLKEAGVSFATDPDGQIAALTNRLAEAEKCASIANTELAQLKESETKRQRNDVIDRICEGMVDTKKDTVVNLLEGIEFQTESEFESRVRTFRNLVEGKDDFSDKVGKDNEKGKPDGDKSEKDIKEGKNRRKKVKPTMMTMTMMTKTKLAKKSTKPSVARSVLC
ncbi:prohead assembly protein [Salmonella phage 38]|uniref:Prohead assembly protein n=1 Tax=Salmonella phage 38 TaxID=1654891 RepID=A0A0N7CFI2_9CAUD|nr:prohead assembly protein [Salmonella phage 38]AKJ73694.1 prohead assembly protein [Salmonella phage 38]